MSCVVVLRTGGEERVVSCSGSVLPAVPLRHDHGPLSPSPLAPSAAAGAYAVLLGALAEAKQTCDELLTAQMAADARGPQLQEEGEQEEDAEQAPPKKVTRSA